MHKNIKNTSGSELIAIVLAAGKGTRMKSSLPKVLHALAGRPMIFYPIQAAINAGVHKIIVVVGHERAQVEQYLTSQFQGNAILEFVVQHEQHGTGHAVLCAMPRLQHWVAQDSTAKILIMPGDAPLIQVDSLHALINISKRQPASLLGLLTAQLKNAAGYGRILRDNNRKIIAIKEHRDCSEEEQRIEEFNSGMYLIDFNFLNRALPSLSSNNSQQEIYLTDLVAKAAAQGDVVSHEVDASEVEGINDRVQLATLERNMLERIVYKHQRAGVTIRDMSSVEIHDTVTIEPDVTLERGVVLRGHTHISTGTMVDVGCVLTDVKVDARVTLKPYTIATQSHIESDAQIGPFSHLRQGSRIGEKSHIGNFVETKNTTLGRESKANHLAYLGDGKIGTHVNVGAGTIFCNYDGFQKHTTVLEDHVFIGSDSQLVAPVTVGEGAYVATGTTVTRDVPPHALAIGRTRQENKEGYATRLRNRLSAQKQTSTVILNAPIKKD